MRTKHTSRTAATDPAVLRYEEPEPSSEIAAGIDVQTVVAQAAQTITAREQSIQQLRVCGDELRAALVQVEAQHEILTGSYNPPMGNSALASSGSNARRNG